MGVECIKYPEKLHSAYMLGNVWVIIIIEVRFGHLILYLEDD